MKPADKKSTTVLEFLLHTTPASRSIRLDLHRDMQLQLIEASMISSSISNFRQLRPTLLGRAIALISGELLANAVIWIAAGLAYSKAGGVLGLALLAWVIFTLYHRFELMYRLLVCGTVSSLPVYNILAAQGVWFFQLTAGLDADHISAIDNATRQLVSLGQLPITCG